MVHTRYGVGQLQAAEARRGCIFSEPLSSVEGVIKNGGVIGSGVKFVSLKEGFRFDGASTSPKISYGDVLRNPMTMITVSAWFKCDNSVATRMTIIGQDYGSTYALYIPAGGTGTVRMEVLVGGASRSVTTTSGGYNDGQWHFAVGTWASGSPVRIYIDGILNNSSANYSGVAYPAVADVNLNIGSSYNSGSTAFKFKGSIRDCKVFNTALDADEIAAYYNGSAFRYVPSIALPMRIEDHDITNVRALDRSGYANHATLGDGSTSTTYPTKLTTGTGYTFDGTTDYMESRNSIGFSSCTFAALVRFDAISLRAILSHGTGGDLFLLGCGVEGGVGTNTELYFSMFSGSWKRAGTSFTPATGKIYSVVGTFDGTTLKLYVDGVLKGTNTAAADTREFPIRVGRRWDAANPNYFDGDIFDVFVSQRCLTATQVIDWDIRARKCLRGC